MMHPRENLDLKAPAAIAVENLSKKFHKKLALNRVGLELAPGEMVALVGASGSGKSTLLRNLNGLQQANDGTVRIFGTLLQENGRLSSRARKLRSQIGFIFQQFNLVDRLSAFENVLVGHLARLPWHRSTLRQFTHSQKWVALEALERVGILDRAYQRAGSLSGGQQQRVAIARCLVQGAKIILADEPIASLDPESARRVMELLVALNREQGLTVVTSLHQVQIVRQYFQRAIALRDGEVMFDGHTDELSNARLNQIYGSAAAELVTSGHGELVSADLGSKS